MFQKILNKYIIVPFFYCFCIVVVFSHVASCFFTEERKLYLNKDERKEARAKIIRKEYNKLRWMALLLNTYKVTLPWQKVMLLYVECWNWHQFMAQWALDKWGFFFIVKNCGKLSSKEYNNYCRSRAAWRPKSMKLWNHFKELCWDEFACNPFQSQKTDCEKTTMSSIQKYVICAPILTGIVTL